MDEYYRGLSAASVFPDSMFEFAGAADNPAAGWQLDTPTPSLPTVSTDLSSPAAGTGSTFDYSWTGSLPNGGRFGRVSGETGGLNASGIEERFELAPSLALHPFGEMRFSTDLLGVASPNAFGTNFLEGDLFDTAPRLRGGLTGSFGSGANTLGGDLYAQRGFDGSEVAGVLGRFKFNPGDSALTLSGTVEYTHPLAAGATGALPPETILGAISAKWKVDGNTTLGADFADITRLSEDGASALRGGVNFATRFGDASFGASVSGIYSSIGAGDSGVRIEGSLQDPTLFGSDVAASMGGGTFLGADRRNFYGSATTEFGVGDFVGHVDLRGAYDQSLTTGNTHTEFYGEAAGGWPVLGNDSLRLGAFVNGRLQDGEGNVGFGPWVGWELPHTKSADSIDTQLGVYLDPLNGVGVGLRLNLK